MLLKDDILAMGAGESGSYASTSEKLHEDRLDLDDLALDDFALGAADLAEMELSPLGNDEIAVLSADDLRALFDDIEESSDSALDSAMVEEEQRKKKRKLASQAASAMPHSKTAVERKTVKATGSCRAEERASEANSGTRHNTANEEPAIGYPAGQMPPLPSDVPGIAWGLPTNPIHIIPKLSPHFPSSSMNHVHFRDMPLHFPSFGGMMPFPMPPAVGEPSKSFRGSGMPAAPLPAYGRPPMAMHLMMPPMMPPIMPICPTAPHPAGSKANVAPGASPRMPSAHTDCCTKPGARPRHPAFIPPFPGMMPLPLPPGLSGMTTGMFPPGLDMESGPSCVGGIMMPQLNLNMPSGVPDIMGKIGSGASTKQKPPLGLQLKKSASFADLINTCLEQSVGAR